MNPVAFTSEESRGKYDYLLEGVNKALLLAGMEMTKEGKLIEVVQAKTLDEVDRRVNSLKKQLYSRAIHSEVQKYCIDDYLRKDYYDAVFEAAKGLSQNTDLEKLVNQDELEKMLDYVFKLLFRKATK